MQKNTGQENKYSKYKFRILEILDKNFSTIEKKQLKISIQKHCEIKKDQFDKYLYAKKGSMLNIPSDNLLIISKVLNVPVGFLYNDEAVLYSGTFNLTK
jgi:hypothetical protein